MILITDIRNKYTKVPVLYMYFCYLLLGADVMFVLYILMKNCFLSDFQKALMILTR